VILALSALALVAIVVIATVFALPMYMPAACVLALWAVLFLYTRRRRLGD
jgi:hypothetical protein